MYDLFVKPVNGGKYKVASDFSIDVLEENICVPRGFVFDGASIPSFAWQIIASPYDPAVMAPAAVHDYLYDCHKTTRKKADEILRLLLVDGGEVSATKAYIIYWAVRMAGGFFW